MIKAICTINFQATVNQKYPMNNIPSTTPIFRQLTNIDTAFKHIRLFSIIVVIASLVICCYSIFKSYQFIDEAQQQIYILANGKAIEAFSAQQKDNIPVEARDHIKMFHHYFFTLDPDDKIIQTNLIKALYLADESAQRQYDNLKENSYYANIISGNISQEVEVDSILIDINQYPYYFRYIGKQTIIRATTIVTRSLITEGYLRNLSHRSDNNSHGLLIEKWNTLENKDIKTENRH
jgi:conjugative transposon TraK protein